MSLFDKAQEPFVPRHRDAQRDDHRRLGERLAVQHEGHNVLPGEVPLLEFAEFRRAGLNERAGHRRPRQADRPGNRLGGGRRVVAARDPIQHAPQQQVIDGAIMAREQSLMALSAVNRILRERDAFDCSLGTTAPAQGDYPFRPSSIRSSPERIGREAANWRGAARCGRWRRDRGRSQHTESRGCECQRLA